MAWVLNGSINSLVAGKLNIEIPAATDYDSVALGNSFAAGRMHGTSANVPSFFGGNISPVIWLGSFSGVQGVQIAAYAHNNPALQELAFRGASSGSFSTWRRVWHDGNLDTASFVTVAGTQTAITGAKSWSGAHTFTGSILKQHASGLGLTIERTNATQNSSIEYKTTGGSIHAGMYDATSWRINDELSLATTPWFEATPTHLSDAAGNVRKAAVTTANAATTLTAMHLNRTVEKSNTTAYTYTIDPSIGAQGDIILVVNSGTAGNVTVAAGSGVTIYDGTTAGSVIVGPGTKRAFYLSATANRWIAG